MFLSSTIWPKDVARKEPLLLEEGGDARSEVMGGVAVAVAVGVAAAIGGERETEIMSLDFWSSEHLRQMDWGSFWRKEALTWKLGVALKSFALKTIIL